MPAAVAVPLAGAAIGAGATLLGADAAARSAEDTAKRAEASAKYGADRAAETSRYGIDVGAKTSAAGLTAQQENIAARKAAYEAAKTLGVERFQTGETAFLSEAGKSSEVLGEVESDIEAGTAEALSKGSAQMAADLASAGVRGGQAATLLGRASGRTALDAQREITRLKLEEEAQKKADLTAYFSAKAAKGQVTSATPMSF